MDGREKELRARFERCCKVVRQHARKAGSSYVVGSGRGRFQRKWTAERESCERGVEDCRKVLHRPFKDKLYRAMG